MRPAMAVTAILDFLESQQATITVERAKDTKNQYPLGAPFHKVITMYLISPFVSLWETKPVISLMVNGKPTAYQKM